MIIGYFSEAVRTDRMVPTMSVNGVTARPLHEYTYFDSRLPTAAKYWADWLYDTETGQWLKDTKDRPSKEELLFCVLRATPF